MFAYVCGINWHPDAVELLGEREHLNIEVHTGRGTELEVGCDNSNAFMAFFLRRYREIHGVSLAEAAKRLGSTSKNAYARYERGKTVPTLEKLNALIQAVSPHQDLVLSPSKFPSPAR